MHILQVPKNKNRVHLYIAALIIALLFCGCANNSDDEDAVPATPLVISRADNWAYTLVREVYAKGSLAPHVRAILDNENFLQIVFYESNIPEEITDPITYTLNHMVYDISSMTIISEAPVIEIDNCQGVGFALDQNNSPLVAYQGGVVRECGQEQQSDAMLSLSGNGNTWSEYTGAIGEVDRNPVFVDGLAGGDMSLAIDSRGSIHLAYQFMFEGCDSMNFKFPAMNYVNMSQSNPNPSVPEEMIEGNIYVANDTGYQRSAGAHNAITLDGNADPVVFYYAEVPMGQEETEKVTGLRMARRQNGSWSEPQWVETGCHVGYISAATDLNGNPAVAYYVISDTDQQGNEHTYSLKYKCQSPNGEWLSSQRVDESTLCGDYCSLAFDSTGKPAIAYYSLQSRSGRNLEDLKYASFNGSTWTIETAAAEGDIGKYNSLVFDSDDTPLICSYSNSDRAIYMFNPKNNN